jgi:hypothetical protein
LFFAFLLVLIKCFLLSFTSGAIPARSTLRQPTPTATPSSNQVII